MNINISELDFETISIIIISHQSYYTLYHSHTGWNQKWPVSLSLASVSLSCISLQQENFSRCQKVDKPRIRPIILFPEYLPPNSRCTKLSIAHFRFLKLIDILCILIYSNLFARTAYYSLLSQGKLEKDFVKSIFR